MKTIDGKPPRPEWPVLLQHSGKAELRVVRDQDSWDIDPELYGGPYGPEDRLIDSIGAEYRLEPGTGGRHSIVPTGRRYDAKELQSIAERHMEKVGRKPEWLADQLRDVAERQRIRATILYLARLAAEDATGALEDGDSSG